MFLSYIGGIFKGVKTLFTGMKVTTSYFVRPWKIVTQKYPENRKTLKMFEAFKGEVTMPHNEKNEHKCTGCGICEINCPNGSIELVTMFVTSEDGKRKKAIDKHIYHLGMCSMCGLCVKTCPSNALKFGNEFEHAVFNRTKLTKVLNQEGSTLMKGVE
jgi:NADH-quinone oxidoreductase subunit I